MCMSVHYVYAHTHTHAHTHYYIYITEKHQILNTK